MNITELLNQLRLHVSERQIAPASEELLELLQLLTEDVPVAVRLTRLESIPSASQLLSSLDELVDQLPGGSDERAVEFFISSARRFLPISSGKESLL